MSEKIKNVPIEDPANSPEVDLPPQHYAIPFSDLSEGIWRNVLNLYFLDAAGTQLDEDDDMYYMLPVENVKPGSAYRLGSQFSGHSKLEVLRLGYTENNMPLISFDFYPNADLDDETKQEAQEVQDKFRADVDEYLQITGHGVLV